MVDLVGRAEVAVLGGGGRYNDLRRQVKEIRSGGANEEQRTLLGAGTGSGRRMMRMGKRGAGRGRGGDEDIEYEGQRAEGQRAQIAGRGRGRGAGRPNRGSGRGAGREPRGSTNTRAAGAGARVRPEVGRGSLSALAPAAAPSRPAVTVRSATGRPVGLLAESMAGAAKDGRSPRGPPGTPPGSSARDQR
jgi:hypothetical protein